MSSLQAAIRGIRQRIGYTGVFVLSLFVILLIIEAIVRVAGIHPIVLPAPSRVAGSFVDIVASGRLAVSLQATLLEWLVGVGLTLIVGLPIGLMMGISTRVEGILEPYVSSAMSVPTTPFLPLFIIWFGLGLESQAIYVLVFTVFELIWLIKSGVGTVRKQYVEIGKVFGASPFQVMRLIVLPASLPVAFEGIRLAVSRGIRGVIVGELLFITTGLGYEIFAAAQGFRTDTIFALIAVLAIMSISVSHVVRWIGHRLTPWQTGLTL